MKERTRLFFYDVWDGVRSEPARMGLSLFAVSIGIFALTLLMAVMSGLRGRAHALVEEMGADTFAIVARHTPSALVPSGLSEKELSILRQNLSDCKISATAQSVVTLDDSITQAAVVGTDQFLDDIRAWSLLEGRFLDVGDVSENRRVAVVSDALSRSKNWHVGMQTTLLGLSFTIVGVVCSPGLLLPSEHEEGSSWGDRIIFIPATFASVWQIDNWRGRMTYDSFFIKTAAKSNVRTTVVTALRLLDGAEPDWKQQAECITPERLVEGVRRMQRAIGWSAGSVVFLCLILGGTTLMSLMLANVRDRIPEIGLRRALGATKKDIAQLFIVESCLVTGLSAVVGAVMAGLFLALRLGAEFIPLRVQISTFLIPVLASLGLGVIFSYWPARAAMQITPAEALRNE